MRFKYLKRLFGRYTKTGVLRNHLIINHLIVSFNVFGDAAIPLRVIQFINSTLRLYIVQLDGIPFLPGESIDGVDDDNVPLVAVVNDAEGSVLKGSKVVTSQYELEPGQKAHYYDVCKMLRLPQFTVGGVDMTGCFWRPHGRKRHGWRGGTRAAPPCCYSSTSPSSGSFALQPRSPLGQSVTLHLSVSAGLPTLPRRALLSPAQEGNLGCIF
jgi:hypothetical protein